MRHVEFFNGNHNLIINGSESKRPTATALKTSNRSFLCRLLVALCQMELTVQSNVTVDLIIIRTEPQVFSVEI